MLGLATVRISAFQVLCHLGLAKLLGLGGRNYEQKMSEFQRLSVDQNWCVQWGKLSGGMVQQEFCKFGYSVVSRNLSDDVIFSGSASDYRLIVVSQRKRKTSCTHCTNPRNLVHIFSPHGMIVLFAQCRKTNLKFPAIIKKKSQ